MRNLFYLVLKWKEKLRIYESSQNALWFNFHQNNRVKWVWVVSSVFISKYCLFKVHIAAISWSISFLLIFFNKPILLRKQTENWKSQLNNNLLLPTIAGICGWCLVRHLFLLLSSFLKRSSPRTASTFYFVFLFFLQALFDIKLSKEFFLNL